MNASAAWVTWTGQVVRNELEKERTFKIRSGDFIPSSMNSCWRILNKRVMWSDLCFYINLAALWRMDWRSQVWKQRDRVQVRDEFGLYQRCREVDSFRIYLEMDGVRELIDGLAVEGCIIEREKFVTDNWDFFINIRTSASLNHSGKLLHLSFSKIDSLHSCIFSMVRADYGIRLSKFKSRFSNLVVTWPQACLLTPLYLFPLILKMDCWFS